MSVPYCTLQNIHYVFQPNLQYQLEDQNRSVQQWCKAKAKCSSPLDTIALVVLRHLLKIPMCVVSPGRHSNKLVQGRLHKFSGSPTYYNDADEDVDNILIPLVIVYNGHDHFVGTQVISEKEKHLFKVRIMLEHLEHATSLYHEINWKDMEPGLKVACSTLKFNVDAVKSKVSSSFTRSQQIATISPPALQPVIEEEGYGPGGNEQEQEEEPEGTHQH